MKRNIARISLALFLPLIGGFGELSAGRSFIKGLFIMLSIEVLLILFIWLAIFLFCESEL